MNFKLTKYSQLKFSGWHLCDFGWLKLTIITGQFRLLSKEAYTRCTDINATQFLLNLSGYKHSRKLGHNESESWDPWLRLEYKNFSVRYLGAEI